MQREISYDGHVRNLLWPMFEQLESRLNGKSVLPTLGYPDLDDLYPGLAPGHLVVVGGRHGVGKTGFVTSSALDLALRQNVAVAFLTLQETLDQLTSQFVANEAMVSLADFERAGIRDPDYVSLADASGRLSKAKLYLWAGAYEFDDVVDAISSVHEKQKARVVFVDGVQMVRVSLLHGLSRDQELSSVVRGLKELALSLNVSIVVTSSLGRSAELRPQSRPQCSDLRDSGDLENCADAVLMVCCGDPVADLRKDGAAEAELIVRKVRRGCTGTVRLLHHPETGRFSPWTAPGSPVRVTGIPQRRSGIP